MSCPTHAHALTQAHAGADGVPLDQTGLSGATTLHCPRCGCFISIENLIEDRCKGCENLAENSSQLAQLREQYDWKAPVEPEVDTGGAESAYHDAREKLEASIGKDSGYIQEDGSLSPETEPMQSLPMFQEYIKARQDHLAASGEDVSMDEMVDTPSSGKYNNHAHLQRSVRQIDEINNAQQNELLRRFKDVGKESAKRQSSAIQTSVDSYLDEMGVDPKVQKQFLAELKGKRKKKKSGSSASAKKGESGESTEKKRKPRVWTAEQRQAARTRALLRQRCDDCGSFVKEVPEDSECTRCANLRKILTDNGYTDETARAVVAGVGAIIKEKEKMYKERNKRLMRDEAREYLGSVSKSPDAAVAQVVSALEDVMGYDDTALGKYYQNAKEGSSEFLETWSQANASEEEKTTSRFVSLNDDQLEAQLLSNNTMIDALQERYVVSVAKMDQITDLMEDEDDSGMANQWKEMSQRLANEQGELLAQIKANARQKAQVLQILSGDPVPVTKDQFLAADHSNNLTRTDDGVRFAQPLPKWQGVDENVRAYSTQWMPTLPDEEIVRLEWELLEHHANLMTEWDRTKGEDDAQSPLGWDEPKLVNVAGQYATLSEQVRNGELSVNDVARMHTTARQFQAHWKEYVALKINNDTEERKRIADLYDETYLATRLVLDDENNGNVPADTPDMFPDTSQLTPAQMMRFRRGGAMKCANCGKFSVQAETMECVNCPITADEQIEAQNLAYDINVTETMMLHALVTKNDTDKWSNHYQATEDRLNTIKSGVDQRSFGVDSGQTQDPDLHHTGSSDMELVYVPDHNATVDQGRLRQLYWGDRTNTPPIQAILSKMSEQPHVDTITPASIQGVLGEELGDADPETELKQMAKLGLIKETGESGEYQWVIPPADANEMAMYVPMYDPSNLHMQWNQKYIDQVFDEKSDLSGITIGGHFDEERTLQNFVDNELPNLVGTPTDEQMDRGLSHKNETVRAAFEQIARKTELRGGIPTIEYPEIKDVSAADIPDPQPLFPQPNTSKQSPLLVYFPEYDTVVDQTGLRNLFEAEREKFYDHRTILELSARYGEKFADTKTFSVSEAVGMFEIAPDRQDDLHESTQGFVDQMVVVGAMKKVDEGTYEWAIAPSDVLELSQRVPYFNNSNLQQATLRQMVEETLNDPSNISSTPEMSMEQRIESIQGLVGIPTGVQMQRGLEHENDGVRKAFQLLSRKTELRGGLPTVGNQSTYSGYKPLANTPPDYDQLHTDGIERITTERSPLPPNSLWKEHFDDPPSRSFFSHIHAFSVNNRTMTVDQMVKLHEKSDGKKMSPKRRERMTDRMTEVLENLKSHGVVVEGNKDGEYVWLHNPLEVAHSRLHPVQSWSLQQELLKVKSPNYKQKPKLDKLQEVFGTDNSYESESLRTLMMAINKYGINSEDVTTDELNRMQLNLMVSPDEKGGDGEKDVQLQYGSMVNHSTQTALATLESLGWVTEKEDGNYTWISSPNRIAMMADRGNPQKWAERIDSYLDSPRNTTEFATVVQYLRENPDKLTTDRANKLANVGNGAEQEVMQMLTARMRDWDGKSDLPLTPEMMGGFMKDYPNTNMDWWSFAAKHPEYLSPKDASEALSATNMAYATDARIVSMREYFTTPGIAEISQEQINLLNAMASNPTEDEREYVRAVFSQDRGFDAGDAEVALSKITPQQMYDGMSDPNARIAARFHAVHNRIARSGNEGQGFWQTMQSPSEGTVWTDLGGSDIKKYEVSGEGVSREIGDDNSLGHVEYEHGRNGYYGELPRTAVIHASSPSIQNLMQNGTEDEQLELVNVSPDNLYVSADDLKVATQSQHPSVRKAWWDSDHATKAARFSVDPSTFSDIEETDPEVRQAMSDAFLRMKSMTEFQGSKEDRENATQYIELSKKFGGTPPDIATWREYRAVVAQKIKQDGADSGTTDLLDHARLRAFSEQVFLHGTSDQKLELLRTTHRSTDFPQNDYERHLSTASDDLLRARLLESNFDDRFPPPTIEQGERKKGYVIDELFAKELHNQAGTLTSGILARHGYGGNGTPFSSAMSDVRKAIKEDRYDDALKHKTRAIRIAAEHDDPEMRQWAIEKVVQDQQSALAGERRDDVPLNNIEVRRGLNDPNPQISQLYSQYAAMRLDDPRIEVGSNATPKYVQMVRNAPDNGTKYRVPEEKGWVYPDPPHEVSVDDEGTYTVNSSVSGETVSNHHFIPDGATIVDSPLIFQQMQGGNKRVRLAIASDRTFNPGYIHAGTMDDDPEVRYAWWKRSDIPVTNEVLAVGLADEKGLENSDLDVIHMIETRKAWNDIKDDPNNRLYEVEEHTTNDDSGVVTRHICSNCHSFTSLDYPCKRCERFYADMQEVGMSPQQAIKSMASIRKGMAYASVEQKRSPKSTLTDYARKKLYANAYAGQQGDQSRYLKHTMPVLVERAIGRFVEPKEYQVLRDELEKQGVADDYIDGIMTSIDDQNNRLPSSSIWRDAQQDIESQLDSLVPNWRTPGISGGSASVRAAYLKAVSNGTTLRPSYVTPERQKLTDDYLSVRLLQSSSDENPISHQQANKWAREMLQIRREDGMEDATAYIASNSYLNKHGAEYMLRDATIYEQSAGTYESIPRFSDTPDAYTQKLQNWDIQTGTFSDPNKSNAHKVRDAIEQLDLSQEQQRIAMRYFLSKDDEKSKSYRDSMGLSSAQTNGLLMLRDAYHANDPETMNRKNMRCQECGAFKSPLNPDYCKRCNDLQNTLFGDVSSLPDDEKSHAIATMNAIYDASWESEDQIESAITNLSDEEKEIVRKWFGSKKREIKKIISVDRADRHRVRAWQEVVGVSGSTANIQLTESVFSPDQDTAEGLASYLIAEAGETNPDGSPMTDGTSKSFEKAKKRIVRGEDTPLSSLVNWASNDTDKSQCKHCGHIQYPTENGAYCGRCAEMERTLLIGNAGQFMGDSDAEDALLPLIRNAQTNDEINQAIADFRQDYPQYEVGENVKLWFGAKQRLKGENDDTNTTFPIGKSGQESDQPLAGVSAEGNGRDGSGGNAGVKRDGSGRDDKIGDAEADDNSEGGSTTRMANDPGQVHHNPIGGRRGDTGLPTQPTGGAGGAVSVNKRGWPFQKSDIRRQSIQIGIDDHFQEMGISDSFSEALNGSGGNFTYTITPSSGEQRYALEVIAEDTIALGLTREQMGDLMYEPEIVVKRFPDGKWRPVQYTNHTTGTFMGVEKESQYLNTPLVTQVAQEMGDHLRGTHGWTRGKFGFPPNGGEAALVKISNKHGKFSWMDGGLVHYHERTKQRIPRLSDEKGGLDTALYVAGLNKPQTDENGFESYPLKLDSEGNPVDIKPTEYDENGIVNRFIDGELVRPYQESGWIVEDRLVTTDSGYKRVFTVKNVATGEILDSEYSDKWDAEKERYSRYNQWKTDGSVSAFTENTGVQMPDGTPEPLRAFAERIPPDGTMPDSNKVYWKAGTILAQDELHESGIEGSAVVVRLPEGMETVHHEIHDTHSGNAVPNFVGEDKNSYVLHHLKPYSDDDPQLMVSKFDVVVIHREDGEYTDTISQHNDLATALVSAQEADKEASRSNRAFDAGLPLTASWDMINFAAEVPPSQIVDGEPQWDIDDVLLAKYRTDALSDINTYDVPPSVSSRVPSRYFAADGSLIETELSPAREVGDGGIYIGEKFEGMEGGSELAYHGFYVYQVSEQGDGFGLVSSAGRPYKNREDALKEAKRLESELTGGTGTENTSVSPPSTEPSPADTGAGSNASDNDNSGRTSTDQPPNNDPAAPVSDASAMSAPQIEPRWKLKPLRRRVFDKGQTKYLNIPQRVYMGEVDELDAYFSPAHNEVQLFREGREKPVYAMDIIELSKANENGGDDEFELDRAFSLTQKRGIYIPDPNDVVIAQSRKKQSQYVVYRNGNKNYFVTQNGMRIEQIPHSVLSQIEHYERQIEKEESRKRLREMSPTQRATEYFGQFPLIEDASNHQEAAEKVVSILTRGNATNIEVYRDSGPDTDPNRDYDIKWTDQTGENQVNVQLAVQRARLRVESSGEPSNDYALSESTRDRMRSKGYKGFRAATRLKDNLQVLKLLKKLRKEERFASNEPAMDTNGDPIVCSDSGDELTEKDVLARYVGWGGLSQAAFVHSWHTAKHDYLDKHNPPVWMRSPDEKKRWRNIQAVAKAFHELYDGDDEQIRSAYDAARESTLNAHYTSPEVIEGVWSAIEKMGYSDGNMIEPTAGTGNWMSAMPEQLRRRTKRDAVEMDRTSAEILQHLHPDTNTTHSPLENVQMDKKYNITVGNDPFGNYPVTDPNAPKWATKSIHSYCAWRRMEMTAPGGVSAFVTSSFLMDSDKHKMLRAEMEKQGELVAAVRMPNNAFEKNAGTQVVTDVIFWRKRDEAELFDPSEKNKWTDIEKADFGERIHINQYFAENPHMVMGKFTNTGSMYGANEQMDVQPFTSDDVKKLEGEVQSLQDAMIDVTENDRPSLAKQLSQTQSRLSVARAFVNSDGDIGKAMSEIVRSDAIPRDIASDSQRGRCMLCGAFTNVQEKCNNSKCPSNRGAFRIAPVDNKLKNGSFHVEEDGRVFEHRDGKLTEHTSQEMVDASLGRLEELKGSIVEKLGDRGGDKPFRGLNLQKVLQTADITETPEYQEYLTLRTRYKLYRKRLKNNHNGIIRDMIPLREAAIVTLNANRLGEDDEKLSEAREQLNATYDAFVEKHGPLNSKTVTDVIMFDPDASLLFALERNIPRRAVNEDDLTNVKKAAIFNERVSRKGSRPETADNPMDALHISMNESGRINWERMSNLLQMPVDEVQADLIEQRYVFRQPNGAGFVDRVEYLSGNVRAKLKDARLAAKSDDRFKANVEELIQVIPEDIFPQDIGVEIGVGWVPEKVFAQFANELSEGMSNGAIRARYIPVTATWELSAPSWLYDKHKLIKDGSDKSHSLTVSFENPDIVTAPITYWELLQAAHTDKQINVRRYLRHQDGPNAGEVVYRLNDDGKPRAVTVVDQAATLAVQEKVDDIKQKFKDWLWEDDDRSARLVRVYNDKHNCHVKPKYIAPDAMTFEGASPDHWIHEKARDYQRDDIYRQTRQNNVGLIYLPGGGKTNTYISGIMRNVQLGLVKKPALVVPSHLISEAPSDFLEQYPTANILVVDKIGKQNAAQVMNQMATGNYDCVIMTHNAYDSIPLGKEDREHYIREQVDEITSVIDALESENDSPNDDDRKRTIKDLEKERKNLRANLNDLLNKYENDDMLTWSDLQFDMVAVDEAHLIYGGMAVRSRHQRVKGINTNTANQSKISIRNEAKIRAMRRNQPHAKLVVSTGTKTPNSVAQEYLYQRLMDPDALREQDVYAFDAWAKQYGRMITTLEPRAVGGGLQHSRRFASFHNVPELTTLTGQHSSVHLDENLIGVQVPQLTTDDPEAKARFDTAKTKLVELYGEDILGINESLNEEHPDIATVIDSNEWNEFSDARRKYRTYQPEITQTSEIGNEVIQHLSQESMNIKKGGSANMLQIISDARAIALDERVYAYRKTKKYEKSAVESAIATKISYKKKQYKDQIDSQFNERFGVDAVAIVDEALSETRAAKSVATKEAFDDFYAGQDDAAWNNLTESQKMERASQITRENAVAEALLSVPDTASLVKVDDNSDSGYVMSDPQLIALLRSRQAMGDKWQDDVKEQLNTSAGYNMAETVDRALGSVTDNDVDLIIEQLPEDWDEGQKESEAIRLANEKAVAEHLLEQLDGNQDLRMEFVQPAPDSPAGHQLVHPSLAQYMGAKEFERTSTSYYPELDEQIPDGYDRTSRQYHELARQLVEESIGVDDNNLVDIFDDAGNLKPEFGRMPMTDEYVFARRIFNAGDNPQGKLSRASLNIADEYHRTTNIEYTDLDGVTDKTNMTQLVWLDMGVPDGDTYNLYGDLKKRLIEQGVDSEHIAFIQDYPTPEDKAKLYEQMRQGDMRILVANGPRATGMNIQDRMSQMHHLDIDWRPDQFEQKNRRGIRFGNKNKEIRIISYLTESSTDAFVADANKKKEQFNKQIANQDAGREMDDITQMEASIAHLQAWATGDDRVQRHAETRSQVLRLEQTKKLHTKQMRQRQVALVELPQQIVDHRAKAERYEEALQMIRPRKRATAEVVDEESGKTTTVQLEKLTFDFKAKQRVVAKGKGYVMVRDTESAFNQNRHEIKESGKQGKQLFPENGRFNTQSEAYKHFQILNTNNQEKRVLQNVADLQGCQIDMEPSQIPGGKTRLAVIAPNGLRLGSVAMDGDSRKVMGQVMALVNKDVERTVQSEHASAASKTAQLKRFNEMDDAPFAQQEQLDEALAEFEELEEFMREMAKQQNAAVFASVSNDETGDNSEQEGEVA